MAINKKTQAMLDYLEECHPDAVILLPDEINDAIVGIDLESERVIYSYDLLIKYYKNTGMTYDEADEFIQFNTIRALPYMGDKAPIILTKLIY